MAECETGEARIARGWTQRMQREFSCCFNREEERFLVKAAQIHANGNKKTGDCDETEKT
jgi:hypothetical protein